MRACGEEIAAWDANFGGSHTLNFTADAAACGPALDIAGGAAVETAFVSVLPGSTFYNPTPISGQTLHLPLDDSPTAIGNMRFEDLSGLGNVGVCSAACPAPAQVGHTGSAVLFDGLDDEIVVAQDQNLGSRDQLSIAFWLQPRGAESGVILFKDNEFALFRNPDNGVIHWNFNNTDPGWGTWISTGAAAPSNQWTHLAVVYSGGTVLTFANGEWVHTYNGAGSLPNQSDLLIGNGTSTEKFSGLLDDLQMFARALSPDEIRSLYLGDGPVLHLPLNDSWASGGMALLDTSGWNQHGSLTAGDALNKAVPGQVGPYALDFDGLDDYAAVPDSPALDLAHFSIGLWVKADHYWQNNTFHPLLVKGTADNAQVNYGLYLDQRDGNLSLRLDDAACATTRYFPFGQAIMPTRWNHVMVTYNGSEIVFYVNNQAIRSEAYTGGACLNDEPIRLGQGLGGTIPAPIYSGALDDIIIYPRALSNAEVESVYARGWQAANTAPTGAGVTLADWTDNIPAGLEGAYRLDLRGQDEGGHVGAPETSVWQGAIDTRAPRLSLETELVGDNIRYTTYAEDFNLTADGFVTPCGAGFTSEQSYFQAGWYQALFPASQRLFGLTAICERPNSELPGEVGGYDTPGLARGVVVSGTLAYLADSGGGLQIVDISDPLRPQSAGELAVGYPYALAVDAGGPIQPPDLTVTHLEASPAAPELGISFTISVTIQNLGVGTSPGFETSLYQDAQPAPCEGTFPLWTATIPQLGAGQSAVVVFSHPSLNDLTPHDFYAQADSGCEIIEADETNNILGPVSVTAVQSDLIVESMVIEPVAIYENQPITATVTIRNQGTGTARNFRTSIYSNTYSISCGDAGWGFDDTDAFAPGETRTFTYMHPGFTPPSVYHFLAVVDTDCSVDESDEFNNTQWDNFTVYPPSLPDLMIPNIQASNTSPLIGESFVVSVTVRNQDVGPAGVFDTAVYTGTAPTACGVTLNQWDAAPSPGLLPSDSTVITFTHPGFASAGYRTISAYADSSCDVTESDEAHNGSFNLTINVRDPNPPDLVIDDITPMPDTLAIGESYVVSVTIRNQGLGVAQSFWGTVEAAILVDRPPLGCEPSGAMSMYRGPLNPGETAVLTRTMSGFAFAGVHHLYATADSGCEIDETDEGNNQFGPTVITVTGGAPIADLVVLRAVSVPYPVTAGQPFSITVNTRNMGTLAVGAFSVGVFTDTEPISTCVDIPWDTRAVTGLEALTSTTVQFNYPGIDTPGVYTFYAMADTSCEQVEFSESNNTDSILVWVQAAAASALSPVNNSETFIGIEQSQPENPPESLPVPMPRVVALPGAPAAIDAGDYTYAYIADAGYGLRIVNVSDPHNPIEVGNLALAGAQRDIAVADGYAYLVSEFIGLHVVDISNPGYPIFLDSLATPGTAMGGGGADGVAVSGNYAFVADGQAGLQIVDISDPANLQLVSGYDTPGYARDVATTGDYAYVADGGDGLQVIQIADPDNPQLAGHLDTSYLAQGVTIDGDTAYLADGGDGLLVVDVADPANPTLLRSFATPGYAKDVAAGSEFAFVADYDRGLRIINPSGTWPQSTACDTAGHCTTVTMEQPLAALAQTAFAENPQAEISYPMAGEPLVIAITNLPAVLDSSDTITITGYATATLTTLDVITVTVGGAALPVQGWVSGVAESDWHAGWTPASDGPHAVQATVQGTDGSTASTTLTVTVDTLSPAIIISPTLYTGSDYYEPRSINLRGEATDAGGVARVEALGVDGVWRDARLQGNTWQTGWQPGDETLPDNQSYTVQVRATDIAGHITTISENISVDVLPPAPVDLTLSSGGVPINPGDLLRVPSANLTLVWDASSDGSGLDDYQVRWITQTGNATLQTWQTIPTSGPLTASLAALDGQKISVQLGSGDTPGNQRWQNFGSVIVDSPFTPDYIPLAPDETYRGWMDSGCTALGVERRANTASYSAEQKFYATWDSQALRLSWLGADWDTDGDLFIYLDTVPGGGDTAYDPYGGAPNSNISLPPGMLADTLVWVQDAALSLLLHWNGSAWVIGEQLSVDSYQLALMTDNRLLMTDLYLTFDQIGLTAGGSLDMLALAVEEGSLDLWAALPQGNLLNGDRVTNYQPAAGESRDFSLSQRYHWDVVGPGICPNGSDQPDTVGAYLDADLQVSLSADPAGAGYCLFGDGLYWLQDVLLNNPPADISSQLDFLTVDQPPLPHGREVTYTLQYYNRGMETAYSVFAEINADYALALPDGDPGGSHQTLVMGDIAPGESGTLTFRGQIDTSRSTESWAKAAVQIFDAAHPNTGAALEYLWVDQRVDREGPIFFGVQQPAYLLGAGDNLLKGYAYDAAEVDSLAVEIQGPLGAESLTCPVEFPHSGDWDCLWNVSGQNGDLFEVRLQATDGYGQASAWGGPQTFMLDTQVPTVTLDVSATQVVSGSLVRGLNFSLYGGAADNGGLGSVDVCLEGDCQPATLMLEAGNMPVLVENIPGTAIPINNASSCGGGEIIRTFEVTQTLWVGNIQLGISALHDRRDDIQATLISPAGTVVQLLMDDGISGTDFRNVDLWLADSAPAGFAEIEGDLTPAAPFYARFARPVEPLNVLIGEAAQGTWTLSICDANPTSHDGEYLRSQLLITPRDANARAGEWSAQVQAGELALDYVPQEITIFGQDVVGNRTVDPLALTVIVDNVAPVITVTQVVSDGFLGSRGTVLGGGVRDGGPGESIWVHVLYPHGEIVRTAAGRDAEQWFFEMDYEILGECQLWVTASDLAGNTAVEGPYSFTVVEQPVIYLPLIFQQYSADVPVYDSDFDDAVGLEWSEGDIETAPNGENFLGQFGNGEATLRLTDLPEHSTVTIAFDLYILRSWDGNQVSWPPEAAAIIPMAVDEIVGPDIWTFSADGETLLTTTFSNWGELGFNQAYPGSYPGGDFPAQTGAIAVNTLGYPFGDVVQDATYHLEFTFEHNNSELQSSFGASSLQIGEDESWGIDNVEVTIAP